MLLIIKEIINYDIKYLIFTIIKFHLEVTSSMLVTYWKQTMNMIFYISTLSISELDAKVLKSNIL